MNFNLSFVSCFWYFWVRCNISFCIGNVQHFNFQNPRPTSELLFFHLSKTLLSIITVQSFLKDSSAVPIFKIQWHKELNRFENSSDELQPFCRGSSHRKSSESRQGLQSTMVHPALNWVNFFLTFPFRFPWILLS